MVPQKDQEEKDEKDQAYREDPKAMLHEASPVLPVSHVQGRNSKGK
jgi:hypothetical protein